LNDEILPLNVAEVAETLPEGVIVGAIERRRNRLQNADAPDLPGGLRARRERPRRRCAAEQRDELAALIRSPRRHSGLMHCNNRIVIR
jgi:hypothetical protein